MLSVAEKLTPPKRSEKRERREKREERREERALGVRSHNYQGHRRVF
jgi:hypothetical protein